MKDITFVGNMAARVVKSPFLSSKTKVCVCYRSFGPSHFNDSFFLVSFCFSMVHLKAESIFYLVATVILTCLVINYKLR